MNSRGLVRRPLGMATDWVVVCGLLGAALSPLVPVYSLSALVPPVLLGLSLATALAMAGVQWRLSVAGTAAAGVVGYLVGGHLLLWWTGGPSGWAPSSPVNSVGYLAASLTTVWKRVLTVDLPVGSTGGFTLAPYLMALTGGLVALSLAWRLPGRQSPWAVMAPLVCLIGSLILGAGRAGVSLPVGLVAGGLVLIWLSWRSGRFEPRRWVAMTVCLVVALGASCGAYWLADQRARLVVRQHVEPPFNPADQPSPLAAYRHYIKDLAQTELLRVSALPSGQGVRLAVMDSFDGVVWNVGGGGVSGSGRYERMAQGQGASAAAPSTSVSLTIQHPTAVWLYSVGSPSAVDFTGDQSRQLREELRVNHATGGLVLTGALPPKVSYAIGTQLTERPSETQIAKAQALAVDLPPLQAVPDAVRLTAAEYTRGANTPGAKALALEQALNEKGYFSHGQVGQSSALPASLAGHGAARIDQLLTGPVMVGDAEQYASAMALMARELGLPARVVLGFGPSDQGSQTQPAARSGQDNHSTGGENERVYYGADMTAWVEIGLAGWGWVPFYPTPDCHKTPGVAHQAPVPQPRPQVIQQPPAQTKPAEPPEPFGDVPPVPKGQAAPEPTPGWIGWWLWVSGVALVTILGLTAGPSLVVLIKVRRRRRRATTGPPEQRIMAGWQEVLDQLTDLRRPAPAKATRLEQAAALAGPKTVELAATLAMVGDQAAFAPRVPGRVCASVSLSTAASLAPTSLTPSSVSRGPHPGAVASGQRAALSRSTRSEPASQQASGQLAGTTSRATRSEMVVQTAPGGMSSAQAVDYWYGVNQLLTWLGAAAGRRQRWRAALSWRSLHQKQS